MKILAKLHSRVYHLRTVRYEMSYLYLINKLNYEWYIQHVQYSLQY